MTTYDLNKQLAPEDQNNKPIGYVIGGGLKPTCSCVATRPEVCAEGGFVCWKAVPGSSMDW